MPACKPPSLRGRAVSINRWCWCGTQTVNHRHVNKQQNAALPLRILHLCNLRWEGTLNRRCRHGTSQQRRDFGYAAAAPPLLLSLSLPCPHLHHSLSCHLRILPSPQVSLRTCCLPPKHPTATCSFSSCLRGVCHYTGTHYTARLWTPPLYTTASLARDVRGPLLLLGRRTRSSAASPLASIHGTRQPRSSVCGCRIANTWSRDRVYGLTSTNLSVRI